MKQLKKYFPYAFKSKPDVTALVVHIIVHIVVGALIGVITGLLTKIPVVGIIFSLLGGLIDLYVLISLVLVVLDYLKVLK